MQGVMLVISNYHLACGLVLYRAGKERLELLSHLSVTINLWRRQMKGMNESEEEERGSLAKHSRKCKRVYVRKACSRACG